MKSIYKNIINDPSIKHVMSTQELLEIQSCLINMLREIVDICEKNDIRPFLVYGNLLGKVRHNGFIPWDDDLDIGMLRSDYNKFSKVFAKEMGDKYYISTPNAEGHAYYRFVQVGRKGTIRISSASGKSDDERNPTSHCFIDVFPFDYSPDNPILRKIKSIKCELMMLIAGCVDFDIKEKSASEIELFKQSFYGRLELFIRTSLHNVFSFRTASEWYHALDKAIQSKESNYLVCSLGKDYYHGSIYRIEEILPLKTAEYCGIKIDVPNDYHEYLKKCYGDYMELPPLEKRQCHSAEKIIINEGLFK